MIYEYFLDREAILITSPSPTGPTGTPCALLELNKAIRHDAAQYFYNHNVVAIGCPNDMYSRSTDIANLHGLSCFLGRTPRFYTNCIRALAIQTRLTLRRDWGGKRDQKITQWSNENLARFKDMVFTTLVHFPNILEIQILLTEVSALSELDYMMRGNPHTLQSQVFDAFDTLFQHPSLRKIQLGVELKGNENTFRGNFLGIERAIECAREQQKDIWIDTKDNRHLIFTETHPDDSAFLDLDLWVMEKVA